MSILSIHPGHNATVGWFQDGRCLEYHHEERFTNLKNHTGFPYRSLEHVLNKYGAESVRRVVLPHEGIMTYLFNDPSQDADYEAIRFTNRIHSLRSLLVKMGAFMPAQLKLHVRQKMRDLMFKRSRPLMLTTLKNRYKIEGVPIDYFDHHTCHALTPVQFYGLNTLAEKCLLITADGAGGDSSSKVFVYDPKNQTVQKLGHTFYTSSLGYIYAFTTMYLGMKPGEHEYKVMGLAAYSTESKYWNHMSQAISDVIQVDDKSLTFQSSIDLSESLPFLKKVFDMQRFDNIAAAVQDVLEKKIAELTVKAVKKTGIPRVAFSGGVFMNVKMNQKLTLLPEVEKVYFQPSCGDESLGIGAAAQRSLLDHSPMVPVRTMYTGIQHDDAEIEKVLTTHNLKAEKCADIEERVADLLSRHEIVARFAGRGEWGARSLCNRAILANANDLKSFYIVNDMVKMRDFWMPFAPTILWDWGERYVAHWKTYEQKARESLKYMIITVESTELAQNHLRAAIHQKDKTLRPQMLEETDNPSMYRILKLFEGKTKMGGVMNTSFNLHGSPLVGSPKEAVNTFINSGLRYLAMGSYLIAKS